MLKSPSYQTCALWLIFVLLITRLISLWVSPLGLHGDEAQYWAWSKDLDWGYFTKPPLIAWVIWLTTSIFGDAEWAVRLSSPLLHSITGFIIFKTGQLTFNAKTGFWAAAIYLLMPALWLSSAIVSTDVPLLLCWAIALNAWLYMRVKATWPRACQLGIAIGFGLLAKYAMLFFIGALCLAVLFDKATRSGLKSLKGLTATLIALVIFTPNILWNFTHDFATVSHTADNANLSGIPFHPLELISFWFEQLIVFGPATFILMLIAIILAFKKKLDTPTLWISLFTLSPFLIISSQAFLSRANANWAVTAYVGGSLLTAHLCVKYWPSFKIWLKGSLLIQSSICLALGVIILSPNLTDQMGLSNSVKRLRKWPITVKAVETIFDHGHEGKPYQTIALDKRIIFYNLTYYGLGNTELLKMWMNDAAPVNHAELTSPLTAQDGPVLILNYYDQYENKFREDFTRLERLNDIEIELGGGKIRHLKAWAGYGYTPTTGRD